MAIAKVWLTKQGTFYFGKHQDEDLEDVASEDPSYLRWIIDNVEDIIDDDREAIEAVLQFSHRRGR